MHLLRYEEWKGAISWYCNDTSDLKSIGALWWAPARMLNISPAEFVKLLIDKFHPDYIAYDEERDVLVYSWKKQSDMRLFKNWLNAEARKRKFYV